MFHKIAFRAGLCVALLAFVSCSAPETVTSEDTAEVGMVETAKAESKELASETSEIIISLGDKKLTMEQIKWIHPDTDNRKMAWFADWWLENELLYAEAKRRGITKEPKAKFIAELMKKKVFSQELTSRVRDAVKISDEKALTYYEENKETDLRIKQPGYLSFSHIRTKTLEEAQAVLERIKAGEDISALAKELSVHLDARRGGVARRYMYEIVEKRFGTKFFEALVAAKEGELMGPIKIKDNAYEVARLDGKIEPKPPLLFEKVKDQIKSLLERTEKANAFKSLLDSLKKEAADKIVRSPLITQPGKSTGEKSKGKGRSEGKQK